MFFFVRNNLSYFNPNDEYLQSSIIKQNTVNKFLNDTSNIFVTGAADSATRRVRSHKSCINQF
jgi:hypothetical protein